MSCNLCKGLSCCVLVMLCIMELSVRTEEEEGEEGIRFLATSREVCAVKY